MKILLAVDTNKEITNISKRLIRFFDLYNLKEAYLDIFHSYETPQIKDRIMVNLMTEVVQEKRLRHIKLLQIIENEIEDMLNNHEGIACLVNSILETGEFLPKIRKQLEKNEYDLLILVPTAKDAFTTFIGKNKVFSLIDSLEIPILILPKTKAEDNSKFNLLGLAKDELSLKNIKSSPIFSLAKEDRKTLVHFGTENFTEEGVKNVLTDNPTKSFMDFHQASEDNNLYIANHKKHEGLNAVLRRSFTKKIVNSGDFNLIVI